MKISLIEQLSGVGVVSQLGEKIFEAVNYFLEKIGSEPVWPEDPAEESPESGPETGC